MVARWTPNPKVRVQILYGLPKKDLTVVPPACYTKGIVNDDEPLWSDYETKRDEKTKNDYKL